MAGSVTIDSCCIDNGSSVIRDRRGILDVVVLLSFATIGGDGDGEETNTFIFAFVSVVAVVSVSVVRL